MKDFFHFFLLTKEILRSVVQFCRPAHQVLVGFLILGSFSAGNWVEELWPFCHLFPLFLLDFYSDCANLSFSKSYFKKESIEKLVAKWQKKKLWGPQSCLKWTMRGDRVTKVIFGSDKVHLHQFLFFFSFFISKLLL